MNFKRQLSMVFRALGFALLCASTSTSGHAGLRTVLTSGQLVVFSTASGQVALDGGPTDTLSPFAGALVPLLSKPGLSFGQMLSSLDLGLDEKSKGTQRIDLSGNWLGEFTLLSNSADSKLKRVALVMGNASYKGPPLNSPVADAQAIGTALLAAGFDVKVVLNATRQQMVTSLHNLSESAGPDGLALVYFSGFGARVNGIDFLVPIDANLVGTAGALARGEFMDRALSAASVVHAVRRSGLSIFFIDACRDNPFTESVH